jgi:hypothetical protein
MLLTVPSSLMGNQRQGKRRLPAAQPQKAKSQEPVANDADDPSVAHTKKGSGRKQGVSSSAPGEASKPEHSATLDDIVKLLEKEDGSFKIEEGSPDDGACIQQ